MRDKSVAVLFDRLGVLLEYRPWDNKATEKLALKVERLRNNISPVMGIFCINEKLAPLEHTHVVEVIRDGLPKLGLQSQAPATPTRSNSPPQYVPASTPAAALRRARNSRSPGAKGRARGAAGSRLLLAIGLDVTLELRARDVSARSVLLALQGSVVDPVVKLSAAHA